VGILLLVVIGLGIALLANWRFPPRNRKGVIMTIVSAVLGAFLGGLISADATIENLSLVSVTSLAFAGVSALLARLCVQLGNAVLYI
jgi:uncharacterized membrane protein YeaQ/YmgE (transglycosylase-associated protein family)